MAIKYVNKNNDELVGTASADALFGDERDNTIRGGAGNDRIYGYGGDDTLYGGSGDDFIQGSDGNDILVGGKGSDKLYGGADYDDFVFRATATTAGDVDVISDFNINKDQLVLEGATAVQVTSLDSDGDNTPDGTRLVVTWNDGGITSTSTIDLLGVTGIDGSNLSTLTDENVLVG